MPRLSKFSRRCDMTDQEAWLTLNALPGLGGTRLEEVLKFFDGNPQKVLNASYGDLAQTGVLGQAVIENIIHFSKDNFLEREYNLIRQKNIHVISRADIDYPSALNDIADAPLVLYVMGDAKGLTQVSLGMVGSRVATYYGQKVAGDFAHRFAQASVAVVSGLARGVDTAAHRGCLRAQGITIGVVGCGLTHIYPKENAGLYKNIVEQGGAVVSELPMEVPPLAMNFPRRNRLIAGLSQATVVVEAAAKSGALITVDYALAQGKDVFAVPGPIDSLASAGSNQLIKDGAKVATSPDDVLEALGLEIAEQIKLFGKSGEVKVSLTPDENRAFRLLSSRPVHIDQLIHKLVLSPAQMAGIMFDLELKQVIRQLPGQYYVKV